MIYYFLRALGLLPGVTEMPYDGVCSGDIRWRSVPMNGALLPFGVQRQRGQGECGTDAKLGKAQGSGKTASDDVRTCGSTSWDFLTFKLVPKPGKSP